MKYLFALVAMGMSFVLIKYREQVGDMIGEANWMKKVGGVHTVVVIAAVLMFFYGISVLTGTEEVFFGPLLYLLGYRKPDTSVPEVF